MEGYKQEFIANWCDFTPKRCSKWCSEIGTGRQISGYEMNETHGLADAGAWVLYV